MNLLLTKSDFVSVHKDAKKDLGQYPAILISRMFNNVYLVEPALEWPLHSETANTDWVS